MDFNVGKHLKALHIRFLPEQATELNISSREFLKKAEFVNIDSLMKGTEDANGSSTSGGGGNISGGGDSTSGGGDSTSGGGGGLEG